jgi:hypothetical protein
VLSTSFLDVQVVLQILDHLQRPEDVAVPQRWADGYGPDG